MSIDAVGNSFLDSVRIALVIWLAVVPGFTGFGRNLEIVATHLRDVVRQISVAEMASNAEVTAWVLLLGAVVADSANAGQWFIDSLANSSILYGTASSLGIGQWFSFVEAVLWWDQLVTSPLWTQELSFEHLLEIARTHR
jgi:hypothetical protein